MALVALLAACTAPVRLPTPTPDADDRRVCEALMTALPSTVLDQPRRPTTAALTSAWGDPPITVSCGVAAPAGLTPTSECFEVNGVGWYAEEADGGYLFATIGRVTVVEVGVPAHYSPEANALVDLADAVTRTVPAERTCA